jgi:hypothetical protein
MPTTFVCTVVKLCAFTSYQQLDYAKVFNLWATLTHAHNRSSKAATPEINRIIVGGVASKVGLNCTVEALDSLQLRHCSSPPSSECDPPLPYEHVSRVKLVENGLFHPGEALEGCEIAGGCEQGR